MPNSSTARAVGSPFEVSDLATLPVILKMREIALVYRKSEASIRREVQAGTFRPVPWDTYPYRWRRDDVAADLARRRESRGKRPHGFASRPKAARAGLKPKKTAAEGA